MKTPKPGRSSAVADKGAAKAARGAAADPLASLRDVLRPGQSIALLQQTLLAAHPSILRETNDFNPNFNFLTREQFDLAFRDVMQNAAIRAELTLDEAMRLAEASHPLVLAREAQLSAAEGTRSEAAALLFNNPEFSTEAIRRRPRGPAGSWNEWAAGISQPRPIS